MQPTLTQLQQSQSAESASSGASGASASVTKPSDIPSETATLPLSQHLPQSQHLPLSQHLPQFSKHQPLHTINKSAISISVASTQKVLPLSSVSCTTKAVTYVTASNGRIAHTNKGSNRVRRVTNSEKLHKMSQQHDQSPQPQQSPHQQPVATTITPQSPQFYVQASVAGTPMSITAPPAIAPAPQSSLTSSSASSGSSTPHQQASVPTLQHIQSLQQPLQQQLHHHQLHPATGMSPNAMAQFQPQVQVIQSSPYSFPQFLQNTQGQFIMPGNLTLQSVQGQQGLTPGQAVQPGINPGQPIQVITTGGKPTAFPQQLTAGPQHMLTQAQISPAQPTKTPGQPQQVIHAGQGYQQHSLPSSGSQTLLISPLLGQQPGTAGTILQPAGPQQQSGAPGGHKGAQDNMQKVTSTFSTGMPGNITWTTSFQHQALLAAAAAQQQQQNQQNPQQQQMQGPIIFRNAQTGHQDNNVYIQNSLPQGATVMSALPPGLKATSRAGEVTSVPTNIQPKVSLGGQMRPTLLPSIQPQQVTTHVGHALNGQQVSVSGVVPVSIAGAQQQQQHIVTLQQQQHLQQLRPIASVSTQTSTGVSNVRQQTKVARKNQRAGNVAMNALGQQAQHIAISNTKGVQIQPMPQQQTNIKPLVPMSHSNSVGGNIPQLVRMQSGAVLPKGSMAASGVVQQSQQAAHVMTSASGVGGSVSSSNAGNTTFTNTMPNTIMVAPQPGTAYVVPNTSIATGTATLPPGASYPQPPPTQQLSLQQQQQMLQLQQQQQFQYQQHALFQQQQQQVAQQQAQAQHAHQQAQQQQAQAAQAQQSSLQPIAPAVQTVLPQQSEQQQTVQTSMVTKVQQSVSSSVVSTTSRPVTTNAKTVVAAAVSVSQVSTPVTTKTTGVVSSMPQPVTPTVKTTVSNGVAPVQNGEVKGTPKKVVKSAGNVLTPHSAPTTALATPSGPPKAMVKPQVLTHVIEGYVIHEASEPFPVCRSSLLGDLKSDAANNNNNNNISEVNGEQKGREKENSPMMENGKMTECGKCEVCGKELDAKSVKLKKGKKFCSSQCGKRFSTGYHKRPASNGTDNQLKKKIKEDTPIAAVNSNASQPNHVVPVAATTTPVAVTPDTVDQRTTTPQSSTSTDPEPMEATEEQPAREEQATSSERCDGFPTLTIDKWSVNEVVQFIHNLPVGREYAEDFELQEIDGQALMLLKPGHLTSAMSIKLGPALKICQAINEIKEGKIPKLN